jgi:hypothetical protein
MCRPANRLVGCLKFYVFTIYATLWSTPTSYAPSLFSGVYTLLRFLWSCLPLAPNIVRKSYYLSHLMAQSSVELRHLNAGTSNHNAEQQHTLRTSSEPQIPSVEFSLPPVDGGKEAWLFLAACWVVEAFTFGGVLPKLRFVSQ